MLKPFSNHHDKIAVAIALGESIRIMSELNYIFKEEGLSQIDEEIVAPLGVDLKPSRDYLREKFSQHGINSKALKHSFSKMSEEEVKEIFFNLPCYFNIFLQDSNYRTLFAGLWYTYTLDGVEVQNSKLIGILRRNTL